MVDRPLEAYREPRRDRFDNDADLLPPARRRPRVDARKHGGVPLPVLHPGLDPGLQRWLAEERRYRKAGKCHPTSTRREGRAAVGEEGLPALDRTGLGPVPGRGRQ